MNIHLHENQSTLTFVYKMNLLSIHHISIKSGVQFIGLNHYWTLKMK
jgi:hypothetical protein